MQSVTLKFNGTITRVIQILILSNSNTEKKVAGSHLKRLYLLVTIICVCATLSSQDLLLETDLLMMPRDAGIPDFGDQSSPIFLSARKSQPIPGILEIQVDSSAKAMNNQRNRP